MNSCEFCGHDAHSGCSQCDEGVPQTPNGWDGGHAVHGFADGQDLCPVSGCSCQPLTGD